MAKGLSGYLCLPGVFLLRLFLGLAFFLILCVIWPILVYRRVLSLLASCFRSNLGLMLSAQSSFFAPGLHPKFNIIIKLRLSGKLDYQRLVLQVTEKCIFLRDEATGKFKFPEFQQRLTSWLGYPFWENEENFQMSQHLHHIVLEDEREVEQECKKYTGTAFALDRSPWAVAFVEINKNPNCHFIWFKFHHGLGDGHSLSKAFMCAADTGVKLFQPRSEARRSCWTRVLSVYHLILTYFRVLHNLVGSVPPSTWDTRDLTADRFMTSIDSVPLSRLKALSRKFGVSVFTIFISVVSGAIRRKFLKEAVCETPNDIKGFTMIPLPHPSNNLTNNFSTFELIHPSDKSEVVERVLAVEKQIRWERRMNTSLVPHYLRLLLWSLPECFPLIIPKTGFCNPISIFPGPTAPVYFCGNIVEDLTFSFNVNAPTYQSLFVSSLSYNGQCRFSLLANKKICHSQRAMEEFGGYILEELKEMEVSPSTPKVESV